jgi:hypothetical protein
MALTRYGAVSGRVLDAASKPYRNAHVAVLKPEYRDGRRMPFTNSSAENRWAVTNNRGEYSIGGLTPGLYYVRADFTNQSISRLEPAIYPQTYSPGTIYPGAALPAEIAFAGDLDNVNIAGTKLQTRRVRGSVVSAATGKPVRPSVVVLTSRNDPAHPDLMRARLEKNGDFDFRGVIPGSYFLAAFAEDGKVLLSARIPIEVADSELRNIKLDAQPGRVFRGRMSVEGWPLTQEPDLAHFVVGFRPENLENSGVAASLLKGGLQTIASPDAAKVSPDGSFTLEGVTAWDYLVRISLNGQAMSPALRPAFSRLYVKSIRSGPADILNGGLHVGSTFYEELEIVLGTDSGTFDGRVLDENGKPVAGATAVVVPNAPYRKRDELYAIVKTNAAGRFERRSRPRG